MKICKIINFVNVNIFKSKSKIKPTSYQTIFMISPNITFDSPNHKGPYTNQAVFNSFINLNEKLPH